MDQEILYLSVKKVRSGSSPLYSLLANRVIIAEHICPAYLVSLAFLMMSRDPHLYLLDDKLESIHQLLDASFYENNEKR